MWNAANEGGVLLFNVRCLVLRTEQGLLILNPCNIKMTDNKSSPQMLLTEHIKDSW